MLKELAKLRTYRNRQVVLTYFEDEQMQKRNGFFFDLIALMPGKIAFWKHEKMLATIDIEESSTFYQLHDFPHYYAIETKRNRVEIYFP